MLTSMTSVIISFLLGTAVFYFLVNFILPEIPFPEQIASALEYFFDTTSLFNFIIPFDVALNILYIIIFYEITFWMIYGILFIFRLYTSSKK
jgi:hypothetical protein